MTRCKILSSSNQAAELLRRFDPNIRAIVLFGSAVYAPKLANDLDLLVITERKRKDEVYWDAVCGLPVWVDVIVHRVGEPLSGLIAAGVRAFGQLIWGDVGAVEEVLPKIPVPTFEESMKRIEEAELIFRTANAEHAGIYREAFNALFDAARMAVMAFLNTEETRWGELRKRLPQRFERRFRRIVNRLHVAYFYRGHLPDDIESAFKRWRRVVERFIDDLHRASLE
ncbi:MAG: nucleotidyltransferase domain-containing protein [Armatimonadetes bacterium]|nr:nucleotidyltransferase domain-containing protein [Armatimonadota bacterium]MCX7777900.1 nucleotidyltransferase domain-containing protein [Armatimonadota bacterium]